MTFNRLVVVVSLVAMSFSTFAGVTAWAADRSAGRVIDDATIGTEIKAKLTADKLSNLTKIDVTTRNGVVTLAGTVDSAERKAEAVKIAKKVKGVKEVVNNIEVRREPSASPSTSSR